MEMNLLRDWPAPEGAADIWHASQASRVAFQNSPDRGVPPSEIQRAALDSCLCTSRYMEGNAMRILGLTFEVHAVYDAQAFKQAWETHLRRHDVYHTGFIHRDGDWHSRTIDPEQLELSADHVVFDSQADSEHSFAAYLETHQPRIPDWDLFTFSALGIDQASEQSAHPHFTVVVALDHLLTDGFSVFMIFEEWMAIYEAIVAGRFDPSALPANASHADYARRDAAFCKTLTSESAQVLEWQRFLDAHGGQMPPFSFDTGLTTTEDFAPSKMTRTPDFLSVEQSDAFEGRCREAGGSLSAGFTAIAALIDKIVRDVNTFAICAPRSTRITMEDHHTMGWFAHPVPVQFPVADQFSDVLAAAKQANKTARAMMGVPVYPAQKLFKNRRATSSMPPEMTSISFIDTRLLPTQRSLSDHRFSVIGTRRHAKSVHYWVNRVGHGVNLNFMHPDTHEMNAGIGAFSALFRAIIDSVIDEGDCDISHHKPLFQSILTAHGLATQDDWVSGRAVHVA